MADGKSAGALRTIGEVSAELGVPQHVLRYWEGKFHQLRPITRAGNRRYYRPEDVALLRRINDALNRDGYTMKGVQKLLGEVAPAAAPEQPTISEQGVAVPVSVLLAIRDDLRTALDS